MRLARLEQTVVHGEDLSAIKKLNRAYGYYVDAGLWEDVADLFADEAVANYPNGTFVGKASIRLHLIENLGGGKIGLGDGRLYEHMILQPVVHLDPGGQTAHGRWRVLGLIGRYGGAASWAGGVYEMRYVKQGGVWKIAQLDYFSGFGAAYADGWGQARAPDAGPAGGGRPPLAHPPDRPRPESVSCPGYPTACSAPFHYANPVTGGASAAWPASDPAVRPSPSANLADLSRRAQRLKDEQEIQTLQAIYGYYLDRGMWDQVADLFADKGTLELGQQGAYLGRRHIRRFLETLGPSGGKEGWLFDHLQLEPIVDLTPTLGYARLHELAMTGTYGGGGAWQDGVYENVFVKEKGVWKIRALRFYPSFISDYDRGWGKDAEPAPGPSRQPPPDRPPSSTYAIYPKAHVALFHFANPVTGAMARYPPELAPTGFLPVPGAPGAAGPAGPASIEGAEALMARVEAFHELENLEDAYGYYVDENRWNDVANLFAADGTMELAQRGVYAGREHIRRFLHAAFGPEGPQAGRLSDHIQLQPVIHVSADGKSAKIRIRLLQMLGTYGGRASWGGGIYENEAIREDGVWKLKSLHAYNTFTADYAGGWAKSPGQRLPGPSATDPPDRPPSVAFKLFPKVFTPPFDYPNPVRGK